MITIQQNFTENSMLIKIMKDDGTVAEQWGLADCDRMDLGWWLAYAVKQDRKLNNR